MRTATIEGRMAIIEGGRAFDLETASGGRFGSDALAALERWEELRAWASGAVNTRTGASSAGIASRNWPSTSRSSRNRHRQTTRSVVVAGFRTRPNYLDLTPPRPSGSRYGHSASVTTAS